MERKHLGRNPTSSRKRHRQSPLSISQFSPKPRPLMQETKQRTAGAISQFILLRGYDWTGTTTFASASATALATVTNPDGPIGKLIFDFQLYLDYYGTGASSDCVSSHITDAFAPAAQWLRCNGRQALLVRMPSKGGRV
jgi:hypothetical protein